MSDLTFWYGKRVFVTGHTGFKGSWLCKTLALAGANVTGYALRTSSEPNLFDICKPGVRSIFGDIRDFETLFAAYKAVNPEIVIHMAAQPLVLDSYNEPKYTYDVNVMGTVNILECVHLTNTARCVLNVTTDKVYLNRERPEGYREDEQLNGYDPYSNSKSCSELVTSSYYNSFLKQAGIAVSTARSGNVIGGGDFSENRLIPDCARAAANHETIKLRNPNSVRPYQHVLDTLRAYLLIAQRQYEDQSLAGAYNIGPPENECRTNDELADMFCENWSGLSWESVVGNSYHESNILRLDCTKIRESLSWKPRWNTEKALKETVRWYKAYYNGDDATAVMMQQIEECMNENHIY